MCVSLSFSCTPSPTVAPRWPSQSAPVTVWMAYDTGYTESATWMSQRTTSLAMGGFRGLHRGEAAQ